MKRIALFLAVSSLHAASYYVSSTGNDSTGNGSSSAPWLTLAHAVGAVASGDIINIVANGSPVTCDVTLPGNITNITVQSSKLALLNPVGYRLNPANDGPNLGKCQLGGTGIIAAGEAHGFSVGGALQTFSLTGSTFKITTGNDYPSNGLTLANGSQIYFEIDSELGNDTVVPGTIVPTPLTILQHYYVVNCSSSPACGAQNSTFQVSATSGGSPITITACDANCLAYSVIALPIQFTPSGMTTITANDALGAVYTNGTPITFGTSGVQLAGTLPSPLQTNTIYYVRDLSGRSFNIAATLGGTAISISGVGTGMQSFSNANVPHGWKFSGIEIAPTSGTMIYSVFEAGGGKETSPLSMVNQFEFDRIYCHDYSNAQNGPRRCIYDNGTNISLHDSYIAGMKDANSDSQAIGGICSLGPTTISNNFLEAAGENILYGGDFPTYYPCANQNKIISGNYLYKPFVWKFIGGGSLSAPSGTCLWDSVVVDPNHHGGEFLYDADHTQGYLCVAGTWATTGTMPNHYGVKNLYENKNARYVTLTGNLLQGSWTDQQNGQAFTMGHRWGSGPGAANDHISTINNKITNTYGMVTWGAGCTGIGTGLVPCVAFPSNHVFKNNLAILGGTAYCGVPSIVPTTCPTGMWASLWSGNAALQDTWDHNTDVAPDGVSGSPYYPVSWIYGTITGGTATTHDQMAYTNGIHSYDFSGGIATFASTWTNSTWSRMALIGGSGTYTGSAGSGNVMNNTVLPANTAAVGFVNASAGDYHLASTSPYSAANGSATLLSSDGTDLGADIDLVNMATSGAAAGTPPWNASLQLTPGSTKLVFRYQAPTTAACTATIYSALARISGNQVASVADSAASSVSDILTRQLYISGLTASTHYWYKLVCAGGVIMVGDFFTRAAGSGTTQFSFDWSAPVPMQYSSSRSMSGAVSLPAATRQFIPVAANSAVYVQVGTTGPITILIAP